MVMFVFFTTEVCLFQVATICIQWRPASFETWTGKLRMNIAGFDRPKVCKKTILCLYSPSLKVHSTKNCQKQAVHEQKFYILDLGSVFRAKC